MSLTTTRTLLQCLCIMTLIFTTTQQGHAEESDLGGSPFHCPEEHVYIYCGELHSDYDYYGYPKALYGYEKDIHIYPPSVWEDLDACGRGTIVRKWKIKYHYDWLWCEQTIHIKDKYGSGFDGKNVHWPKDYHMKECGGNLKPDNLPYGSSWPEFDHHGCAKLGVRYTDKVHPYSSHESGYGGGYGYHDPCKVVFRTWELIDWCQYEKAYGGHYAKGVWTYIQKIYIYDDVSPEITDCPQDMEVDGGDCDGTKVYVKIPPVKAKDDCGEVYYSYTRKYVEAHGYSSSGYGNVNNYGGADASGYYEPGRTHVTFTAFDICGNATECDFYVDVVAKDNKPPTVIAVSSITAVLLEVDSTHGEVELWPREFNVSSRDNCTATEDLIFKLEPYIFTCDDIGTNEVKFIVEDEAGNFDFTIVEVIVQSNSFNCMGGPVEGQVVSDHGDAVEGVEVTFMDGQIDMTNDTGGFTFTNIPLGMPVQISAFKGDNPRQGVDMYDYSLLSMHVDGIRELKDPKQLIAADIDGNKVIDYQDMLALQRIILGIDQEMKHSWIFYKPGFVFPDTIDPLLVEMPQTFSVGPLNRNDMTIKIEGIKIGDIGQKRVADVVAAVSPGGDGSDVTYNRGFESDHMTLFQNNPNPFKNETTIGFYLPEAGEAVVTIQDTHGKTLLSRNGQFGKGYSELVLSRNEIISTGILFYQIRSQGETQTRKMLIVN